MCSLSETGHAARKSGARSGLWPSPWHGCETFNARSTCGPTNRILKSQVAPSPSLVQPLEFAAQALAISGFNRDLAIAPDGSYMVYIAGPQAQLMVRAIDRLDAQAVPGIISVYAPFLSPDGRWIGFFTSGASSELKKVSITGGSPVPLCRINGRALGASWGADGTIVFATNDQSTGLLRVSERGGEPKVLTTPDPAKGEDDHLFPSVLPGGRGVLFTITAAGGNADAQIGVLDQTGRQTTLIKGASHAEYVETGHLIYAVTGTLRAVRFDLATLALRGDPVPVAEQVQTLATGAANFSVSQNGTLVYVQNSTGAVTGARRSLVWVTRRGSEQSIPAVARAYFHPRLSPDGKRLALAIQDQEQDIWTWDFARGSLERMTFGPASELFPVWTPDGKWLLFGSSRTGGGIYRQRADMPGDVEQLTTSPSVRGAVTLGSLSPDGKQLVVTQVSSKEGRALFLLTVDGFTASRRRSRATQPLIQLPSASVMNGEISPNGRWLAYQSNESNQDEIYVRPFPSVATAAGRSRMAGAPSRCGRGTGVSCSIATGTPSCRCRSRQRRPSVPAPRQRCSRGHISHRQSDWQAAPTTCLATASGSS